MAISGKWVFNESISPYAFPESATAYVDFRLGNLGLSPFKFIGVYGNFEGNTIFVGDSPQSGADIYDDNVLPGSPWVGGNNARYIDFGDAPVDIGDVETFIRANATEQAKPPYRVLFYAAGTSIEQMESVTTAYGEAIPPNLPVPNLPDKVFRGWYYDLSHTRKATSGDIITSETKLYAYLSSYTSLTWSGIRQTFPCNVLYSLGELALNNTLSWSITKLGDWSRLFTGVRPSELINAIIVYPFYVHNHTSVKTGGSVAVVDEIARDSSGTIITGNTVQKTTAIITITVGTVLTNEPKYRLYAPYTAYDLYIPYYGFISLKDSDVVGKTVSLEYIVDLSTGDCTVQVKGGGVVIAIVKTTIGVHIPFGGVNTLDHARNLAVGGLNAITNVGRIAAGDVAGGLYGIVSSALNMPSLTIERGGSIQAFTAFSQSQYPFLRVVKRNSIINGDDPTFASLHGRPCYTSIVLSELSGYTEVESVHVEGVPASEDECREIESLLKGGVII